MTSRFRSNHERGAVAVVIAVLFSSMTLLACAALTVDLGKVNAERRQLQNGADAVALSVAKDCAAPVGCLGNPTMSDTMANTNSADDWAAIKTICGKGPGLTACPAGPLEDHLRECVEPATMPDNWVRVYTTTQNSADTTDTILPYSFAQTLSGDPGKTVQACAQAGLVPGFPGRVAPVVQAQCAWDYATNNGTSFPTAKPPYSGARPAGSGSTLPVPVDMITMIRLHTGGNADGTKCSAAGPGHYAPGSFGWLDADDDCESAIVSDMGTVDGEPGGAKPNTCDWEADVEAWVGQTLYIPIFEKAEGNGSGTKYTINGVSAFYVAGMAINNAEAWAFDPKAPGLTDGTELHACYKNLKWPVDDPSTTENETTKMVGDCMWGWFLDPIVPAGEITDGTPRGPKTISLLG